MNWKLFLIAIPAAVLAGCASPSGGSSGGVGTDDPNVYVSPTAGGVDKVAILPFKAPTTLIGTSVSDMFVTEMMKIGRYDMVERSQISGVLGESEVALSGLTAGQAAQVGQMVGANGVIIGTVSEYELVAMGGRTYPVVGISIRLIDCTTGKILWSVDHAERGNKGDTLAQHSRNVVKHMALALERQL